MADKPPLTPPILGQIHSDEQQLADSLPVTAEEHHAAVDFVKIDHLH